MHVEHRIDIDAPPELVFEVNTNIERWPALTPTVTWVEQLGDAPLKVGSQARLKQPRQRPTLWTVEVFEPGRRFVWGASAPGMRMTAEHRVEPTAKGCTNTLALDLEGAVPRLFGTILRRRLAVVLATENEGFRRESLRLAIEPTRPSPPT